MSQAGNGNADLLELLSRILEPLVRDLVRKELASAPHAGGMITVAQAAERLAMSASYIRAAIADGRLPATKVGRAVRVAISDVDALQNTRPRCARAKPSSAPLERAATVDIGSRVGR